EDVAGQVDRAGVLDGLPDDIAERVHVEDRPHGLAAGLADDPRIVGHRRVVADSLQLLEAGVDARLVDDGLALDVAAFGEVLEFGVVDVRPHHRVRSVDDHRGPTHTGDVVIDSQGHCSPLGRWPTVDGEPLGPTVEAPASLDNHSATDVSSTFVHRRPGLAATAPRAQMG